MQLFDDPLDPFAQLQRIQTSGARPQQQPRITPLSEEEEQSILPRISSWTLGGLGYVGSALEKALGGRAIRGLLGGKPRELLSIIPFSDALGITDYADRVSGRDLLRNAGLIGHEDNWKNFLGGLATEIALDPSTYLTFGAGAASKAGQVARKIGQLPKTARGRLTGSLGEILQAKPLLRSEAEVAAGGAANLQSLLNEPLGGLFGVRIPFLTEAKPLLTGQSGVRVLDTAADVANRLSAVHQGLTSLPYGVGHLYKLTPPGMAGEVIKYGSRGADWLGRHLGALFDSSRMGATTHIGQEAAQDAFSQILPYMADARKKMLTYGEELANLGVKDPREFRGILEGVISSTNPRVNVIAKEIRDLLQAARLKAESLGINIKEWGDPFLDTMSYIPRYWAKPVKVTGGVGDPMRALNAVDAQLMTGRKSILEGFREGSAGIDDMILDPAVHQGTLLQRASRIRDYLVDPRQYVNDLVAQGKVAPADAARVLRDTIRYQREQSRRLANWVASLPEEYMLSATGQIPEKLRFFGHHPLEDLISYFDRFAHVRASAEAAHNLIARNVLDAAGATLPKGAVGVQEALEKAGLVSPTINSGAMAESLNRINALRAKQGLQPLQNLYGQYITEDVANELGRYMRSFSNPEALNPFVRAFDWATNLFKTYVTSLWPGFHIRNLTSGQVADIARTGGLDALREIPATKAILAGKSVEGLNVIPEFANMTAQEATRALAREMAAWGIGGHMPHIGREILGPAGQAINLPHSLDDVLSRIPGYTPKDFGTVWEALRGARPGVSWSPKKMLDVAGVNTTKDVFAPVVAGREVGDIVEGVNRGAQYLALRKAGFNPEAAAREVLATHFDYTGAALTPFEKTWMRRLVPFYCVPDDCEILTRRGWLKVDELEIGEDVLTMNHDTGESFWAPCEGKSVFDYDGMLMEMGGHRERFAFTPNHRWPVIQLSTLKGKATKHRVIRTGMRLRENHLIPRTSVYREDSSIATPREAAIVGWVVTDGYQRRRDGSPNYQELIIYQSPGKHLQEIIDLLGDGGSVGKPHPDTGVVPVRLVGELRRRISELIPSKDKIVEFVCRLNPEAARACYDAMLKADGSLAGPHRRVPHFAQNDGPVLDAFQILAQMVGYVAHKSERGTYVSTVNSILKVCRAKLGTCWYKGRVWCPQTKHGTWLMRRNGRVIWTGNSFTKGNIPAVVGQMAREPGGLYGQLARLALNARQQSGFMPAYIGEGLAIPVGQETPEGVQRYLSRFDLPADSAFEMLKGGGLQNTIMGVLGQLNPIIKMPLEYGTNRQFFTGRELGDLYTMTGNQLLDHLLFNSPAARLATTIRQATDPRKDLPTFLANVLTGLKFTDVDMPKYQAIAERDYIKQVLQNLPEVSKFETIAVRPEMAWQLSPDELQLVRLQKLLEKRAREKQKKKIAIE